MEYLDRKKQDRHYEISLLDVTPEEMEAAKKMPLNLYDFPLFNRRWLFGLLLFLGLWLSGRDETEFPVKAVRKPNQKMAF